MKRRRMHSQAYLKQLFRFDPLSGDLFWKGRPREHFCSNASFKRWNSVYPGSLAGNVSVTGGCGKKYRIIRINGENCRAHRIIWKLVYGKDPESCIDHIDGDGTNNALSNIRCASYSENNMNRGLSSRNKSGVCGVLFDPTTIRWTAKINHKHKKHYLGRFSSFLDAVAARKSAELRFGFHENHGFQRA